VIKNTKNIFLKDKLDKSLINKLIDKGMNVKEIAEYYNTTYTHFIKVVRIFLGEYLSVYIAKRKKRGIN
jgi:Mor family transcriptional regulator